MNKAGGVVATTNFESSSVNRREGHRPRVVQLKDGRFEVRCLACGRRRGDAPVGIGLPVHNRFEAEAIARNHYEG